MKKVNVGVTAAHLSEAGVVTVGSQSTGSGRWPKYVAGTGHSLQLRSMGSTSEKADIWQHMEDSTEANASNESLVWPLPIPTRSPSIKKRDGVRGRLLPRDCSCMVSFIALLNP